MKGHILRRILTLSIFILIGMGIFWNFSQTEKITEKKTQEKALLKIKAEKIFFGEVTTRIASYGRVTSDKTNNLFAEVGGKLQSGEVKLKEGAKFLKGQLLYKIDNPEFFMTLSATRSDFMNLVANVLPDIKYDFLDFFEEWNTFFDQISPANLLPKLPKIEDRRLMLFLSNKNVLSRYYTVKSSEERWKKHFFYAPYSGIIFSVNAEPATTVSPGGLIASIKQTDRIEVKVPLTNEEAELIYIGKKVKIISNLHKKELTGQVIRKSEIIDMTTQSINVFVKFSTKKSVLILDGEYVEIIFDDIVVKDVFEIPRESLFNFDEIYIIQDSLLTKAKVNIVKLSERTALINGLEEGTTVVLEPISEGSENTKVEIL